VTFADRPLAEFGDILWTDEAIFILTPDVLSLIGTIWTPEQLVEKPLHPESVHVWTSFSSRLKLPPFFFAENVSGATYSSMLATHCIPFLTRHHAPHFNKMEQLLTLLTQ
jgi:hypothetical protein